MIEQADGAARRERAAGAVEREAGAGRKSRRVGGASSGASKYARAAHGLGMRWIIQYSRRAKEKTMAERWPPS